jgi:hypothetical protein
MDSPLCIVRERDAVRCDATPRGVCESDARASALACVRPCACDDDDARDVL